MRQGCTGPPPPSSLQSCIGLQQNFIFVISRNFHKVFKFVFCKIFLKLRENQNYFFKIHVSRNFDKIIFYFAKLEKNLAKHKIKISQNYENKIFAATLLLHNLLSASATHPPLLSARRFFNAARQCYFYIKTNKGE